MNKNIDTLIKTLQAHAPLARPASIDCDVADIVKESGLSSTDFIKAIEELKKLGMIKLYKGNNVISDIELTTSFCKF